MHRYAQRGEEPFVGLKIVIREVVQELVRVDMLVVCAVVGIDLRGNPLQVPCGEVGVEPLLRKVGFQVAVVVGRGLLRGFPACENLVGQVVSTGACPSGSRFDIVGDLL